MYVSDCSLIRKHTDPALQEETSLAHLNKSLRSKFASKLFRKEYFGWSRVVLHIFLGLGLYLFDIFTDILVVVTYYEKVEWNETNAIASHNDAFHPNPTNQSEVINISNKLTNRNGADSLGPLNDGKLRGETLFYTFLFFLVAPNVVYNLISLCLYIIGTYRLKSYVRSWLTSPEEGCGGFKTDYDARDISVTLFKSSASKFIYYLCMVLSHLILLAPIFRLGELIYITSRQVLLRSKVKFFCKKCRSQKPVKTRCVRKSHAKRRRGQNGSTWHGQSPSKGDHMDVAAVYEINEDELRLKLAHADALQSWADCKFLQCIESNLESLPQLTIQTYVFITGQFDQDNPWTNYVSFVWSVLSFSYSLASFKHMPYDYDAASHRQEEETFENVINFTPSTEATHANGTTSSVSPQSPMELTNLSGAERRNESGVPSPGSPQELPLLVHAPDEVDVTKSDHCQSCCPNRSGRSNGRFSVNHFLIRIFKAGCCPCIFVAKKSVKFFYTFSMGLIIGPRVLALSTLAKVNKPALIMMLTVHSAIVIAANIFANIQLCYKLMQFDVRAQDDTTPAEEPPENVPAGEDVAKTLFPQLSVTPSVKGIPYIDDEPSSRSDTHESTPLRDDIPPPVIATSQPNSRNQAMGSPLQRKNTRDRHLSDDSLPSPVKMRFDQEDGTLGPVKFLDMPEPRLLSRIKDKHLWHLATFVQFIFNIIISIPFFFYFLHVQEIKRTRYLASAYYILWFLENMAIVALNIFTYHSLNFDITQWSLNLLASSGCILIIPLAGFLLLLVYYRKLHPETKRKFLQLAKENAQTKQVLTTSN